MMRKRILSVILALTLVFGTVSTLVPVASADDEETYYVTTYSEIKEYMEDDGNLKVILSADIDESFSTSAYDGITSEITLGEGSKILDLNGHTLRVCDTVNKEDQGTDSRKPTMNLFCIPEEASLTVIDDSTSDVTYTGSIKFDAYMIGGEAKAVPLCSFKSGEFTCVAVRNIFLVESGGELTVNEGAYECGREKKQHLTEAKRYKFEGYEPGKNDNDFCDTFTAGGSDYDLWHSKDVYQVVFGAPVVVSGGKVTINNGYFLARGCSRSNMLCNWTLYALGNPSAGDPTRAAVMITGKKSEVVINNGVFRGRDGAQSLFIKESIRDTISLDIYAGFFTTEKGVNYIRITEPNNPDRGYAEMFRAYTFIPTEYVRGTVKGVDGDPVILNNIFGRGFSAYTSNIYIAENPKILAQSTNETCTVGETVTLSIKAEKATSYLWQKYAQTDTGLEPLGEAVYGYSNGTFYVTSDLQEEAVYKCTVKNSIGSTESEPIYVKFIPEEKNYDIWVCGKQLSTSDHGNLTEDGYTFDVDENMLYLYNFTDNGAYNVNGTVCSSIYTSSGALNITLTGKNKISNTDSTGTTYYGLYAGGNINLFGEGTLQITLDGDKASNSFVGIYSAGGQIKFWDAPNITIDGSAATKSFTGILSYGDVWFDGAGCTRIICSSTLDESKNTGVAIVGGNGIEGNGKGVIKYAFGRIMIFSEKSDLRPFKGYTEFDELNWYKITVDSEKINRKDSTAINTALNSTANTVKINFCEYYDLSVNGTDVNEENFFGADGNGGYWVYDDDENILYLKNVTITSGTALNDTYKTVCGITTEKENLEISLVGDNRIDFSDKSSVSALCGIQSSGNLTFTGNGNLTVVSEVKAADGYFGISCNGLLTFKNEGTVRIDFSDKTDKSCVGIMYTSEVLSYQSGDTNILGGLVCEQGNVISIVGKGRALWDLGSNGDKTLTGGMIWRYGTSETAYTETKDPDKAYTGLSSGCKFAAFLEQNTLYVSLKAEDFPISGCNRLTAGSDSVILADTDDYTIKTANTADSYNWKSEDGNVNADAVYKYGESYYTYLRLIVKNKDLQIDTGKIYSFIINGVECSATCVQSGDDYIFTVSCDCISEINGDKIDLTSADVSLSATSYTYNGSVKKPTVTVIDEYGDKLTRDTDYTLTYSEGCKNAGTYCVTLTGIGEYEGTVKKFFKINAQTLTAGNIVLSFASSTFNNSVKKPTVTVKNSSGTTLTNGTSYTVSYCCAAGCKAVGTHKVTVTGKGNYTGTVTKTFTITKQPLAASRITLSNTSYTFNNSVKKPTVTAKAEQGTTLTNGTSYTVSYCCAAGCKAVGTHKVTITGKGNYTGTVTKTFSIKKQPLSASLITLSYTSCTYTAAVKKPTVTVKSSQGTTLTNGGSYTVNYCCASGCKTAGTHKVTITGKGNYTGTVTKTFTINKQPIISARVTLSSVSFKYDGAVKKPTATVKTIQGTTLTEGTSYKVSYCCAAGCKTKGTHKVTVTAIGSNYTGTVTKTFTIQ